MIRLGMFLNLWVVWWVTGCVQEAPRVPLPSTEGVKLEALNPKLEENPSRVIFFEAINYLVDPAHSSSIRDCYHSLPEGGVRFFDKQAFEENGFFAVRGTGMQFNDLNTCLLLFGAERVGQTTLVLESDAEMPLSEKYIDREQIITYATADGSSSTMLLQNGTLGWWLTARSNPAYAGQVHARIFPIFMPHGLINWPGVEHYSQKMVRRFTESRFDVSFREGDFVVLGVNSDSIEKMTPFQRLLFLGSGDKPKKIRLYIIYCVKAN
jgi:hypothetical protein